MQSHIHALEEALALDRKVNESILALHVTASEDAHLQDFLEANFLDEQVQGINELSKMITNAKRCGDGLGVYQFDKNMKWTKKVNALRIKIFLYIIWFFQVWLIKPLDFWTYLEVSRVNLEII